LITFYIPGDESANSTNKFFLRYFKFTHYIIIDITSKMPFQHHFYVFFPNPVFVYIWIFFIFKSMIKLSKQQVFLLFGSYVQLSLNDHSTIDLLSLSSPPTLINYCWKVNLILLRFLLFKIKYELNKWHLQVYTQIIFFWETCK